MVEIIRVKLLQLYEIVLQDVAVIIEQEWSANTGEIYESGCDHQGREQQNHASMISYSTCQGSHACQRDSMGLIYLHIPVPCLEHQVSVLSWLGYG